MSRIGYLLARPALVALRERLDPRTYNGALFVGLNGVVIKSHGGSDARGFASALGVAVDMVRGNFNEHLIEDLEAFAQDDAPPPRVAVS
jgi:glycerol-3-phosphate acyltransferase PlsX